MSSTIAPKKQKPKASKAAKAAKGQSKTAKDTNGTSKRAGSGSDQKEPKKHRSRVQVDLCEADWGLLGKSVEGSYHRGRRLRELVVLGLAAEAAGLTYVMEAGMPSLRGRGGIMIGLREMTGTPAGVPVSPSLPAVVEPAAPEPQPVVLPEGFMEQW